MPAGRGSETINIGASSNIENINLSALPRPGELGQAVYTTTNKGYQLVQLDSGATSATGVGVTARGQLAYWKDKTNYIVTNDITAAIGANSVINGNNSAFRNEVAGVFMIATTAGNFTAIQQRGNMSAVKTKASTYNIGDTMVGDTTASTAQGDAVAAGTALTVQGLGKAAAARSGGTVSVDLDIPVVP